jgi:hypothetical protein
MKTFKSQTPPTVSLLLAAAALAAATPPARAQDATGGSPTPTPATTPMAATVAVPGEDPWQFGVTVPLWAPRVDGNFTVFGRQENVSIPFSKLKDHLDASFSLALNAQKGRFGMFGNVGYMKFSGGFNDKAGGNFSADLKFLIANAGVSYLLVKTGEEHPFTLAATAGLRYWYASTDLDHHDAFGHRDFHGYVNWNVWDPVLGLRASQYFTQKLHLDVAGDGGGFNINNDTDWTWSASGMLTYDFCRYFTASAGYQALALDESNGSGASKNGVNLIFNGVAALLTFKF